MIKFLEDVVRQRGLCEEDEVGCLKEVDVNETFCGYFMDKYGWDRSEVSITVEWMSRTGCWRGSELITPYEARK